MAGCVGSVLASTTHNTVTLVINVYMDAILCIFGYVGNLLILYVLHKDTSHNSNTVLMQALAVYDLFFLTHTMLYTVLRSVYPTTGALKAYHDIGPYIVAFDLPFGWTAQTGTIWLTMLLAVDRYIAISRPFKAMVICTVVNARKAIIITTVIALLFNLPRFPHYYLVAMYTNSNATFVAHIKTQLPYWNTDVYHYLYHIALTMIFLFIIPLISLSVVNMQLMRALRSARERRQSMGANSSPRRHHNVTIILNVVLVISKFIMCETPDLIAGVIGAFESVAATEAFLIFSPIKEMMLVLNSTLNFYIYCIFNSRFRQTLAHECPCCRCCCQPCRSLGNSLTRSSDLNASSITLTSSICNRPQPSTPTLHSVQHLA